MDTIDWLTGALVLITAYYAWRTQQMVREMRQARELSVQPILAIELKFVGPNFADVAIINVGAGPAFDVDVEIVAEPAAGADRERDVRKWRTSVLAPVGATSSRRSRPPHGELGARIPKRERERNHERRARRATGRRSRNT